MKTSPAFQFYPKDYLGDLKVNAMSLAEQGAYWRLCCHCWLEGSIPDDPVELASVVGAEEEEFADWWGRIRRCFRASKKGRLVHPRMQLEKKMQKKRKKLRAEAGKKGAEKTNIQRKLRGNADKVPSAKVASSSSSSSSTPVLRNLEEKTSSSREPQLSQVETLREGANGNSPRSPAAPPEAVEIFDHWQRFDKLITHKALSEGALDGIKARLREGYTPAELCEAVSIYAGHVERGTAPGHNAWTLEELMKGGKGRGKHGKPDYIDRMLDPHYEGIVERSRTGAANQREMDKFLRRDFS